MVETPDVIEKYIPDYCSCCGKDVSSLPYKFAGKRQLIDIPDIKFHVTEHQIFKKVCKVLFRSAKDLKNKMRDVDY